MSNTFPSEAPALTLSTLIDNIAENTGRSREQIIVKYVRIPQQGKMLTNNGRGKVSFKKATEIVENIQILLLDEDDNQSITLSRYEIAELVKPYVAEKLGASEKFDIWMASGDEKALSKKPAIDTDIPKTPPSNKGEDVSPPNSKPTYTINGAEVTRGLAGYNQASKDGKLGY